MRDRSAVRLEGRRWWLATGLVLAGALVATLPTTGDLGLTWDEPAYRYSQVMSAQWWERLARRTAGWDDVRTLLEPDTLLYYWPYGRHGINFHPPLAGQLDLLTHALFGGWVKDIPARRLASVFEYALTITLGFGFLARRYGAWVGGIAGGRPAADAAGLRRRPHRGDRHARACCSGRRRPWRSGRGCTSRAPGAGGCAVGRAPGAGLRREDGGGARPAAAPGLAGRRPSAAGRFTPAGGRADWIDGLRDDPGDAAAPLATGVRWRSSASRPGFRPPDHTNLFVRPPAEPRCPGAILAVPLPGLARPPAAGPDLPAAPGLGRRAARARDLDVDPGLRPARRLAGQPRLVARDAAPAGPLLHAQHRSARAPCPTSGSSTSARPTSTASPGTTPGS